MSWLVHPLKRFKYISISIYWATNDTNCLFRPISSWDVSSTTLYAKTCIHILSNKWYKQEVEEHSGEARYKPALGSGFAIVWWNQIQECIRVWLRMSVLALRKACSAQACCAIKAALLAPDSTADSTAIAVSCSWCFWQTSFEIQTVSYSPAICDHKARSAVKWLVSCV